MDDFTLHLPPELCFAIFSLLSPAELARACCVSRHWNCFCNDQVLWKYICIKKGYYNPRTKALLNNRHSDFKSICVREELLHAAWSANCFEAKLLSSIKLNLPVWEICTSTRYLGVVTDTKVFIYKNRAGTFEAYWEIPIVGARIAIGTGSHTKDCKVAVTLGDDSNDVWNMVKVFDLKQRREIAQLATNKLDSDTDPENVYSMCFDRRRDLALHELNKANGILVLALSTDVIVEWDYANNKVLRRVDCLSRFFKQRIKWIAVSKKFVGVLLPDNEIFVYDRLALFTNNGYRHSPSNESDSTPPPRNDPPVPLFSFRLTPQQSSPATAHVEATAPTAVPPTAPSPLLPPPPPPAPLSDLNRIRITDRLIAGVLRENTYPFVITRFALWSLHTGNLLAELGHETFGNIRARDVRFDGERCLILALDDYQLWRWDFAAGAAKLAAARRNAAKEHEQLALSAVGKLQLNGKAVYKTLRDAATVLYEHMREKLSSVGRSSV